MKQALATTLPAHTHHLRQRHVVVFVVLLVLVALAALAWKSIDDREKERAIASGALQLQSQALTSALDAAFASTEQTLLHLAEQMPSAALPRQFNDALRLRDQLLRSPYLQDLRWYGAHGELLARGALTPLANRDLPDWLRRQQAQGRWSGFGGAPDELAIFWTVRTASGAVSATLMATISNRYFQGVAEQLPGADIEVSFLLDPANRLLLDVAASVNPAEHNVRQQLVNQIAALAPDQGLGLLEIGHQMVVIAQLRSQPLRLVQAVSKELAFERWTTQLLQSAIMAAMIVLAAALFLWLWLRAVSRGVAATKVIHALQQEQQRLIKSIPVGVYKYRVCATGGDQFDYVSERLCQELGLQAPDLLRNAHLAFDSYQPADLARLRATTAQALATDGHMIFEGQLKGDAAPARWLRLESVLTRQDNGDQVWDGVQSDITERVQIQSEMARQRQSLANIVWGTGVGTWEWQVQTGECRFNERWAELMGYTLAELAPVSITTWMQHAHPDDLAASAAALEQHFAGVTDAYEFESRMQHRLGHWIWVIDRGRVVSRGADGKPLWMAGTHFDITTRKHAEAALQEKARELLRSNAELEQFSYSISHDLRQPLRMISSYLQLLQMGLGDTLDAEKREFFGFAIDGAKRMDAMMLGLLDYSRVGRKGEPPAWLDSRAVLDEALQFLRPWVTEAQADVRIEGAWPRVLASPDELLRLLQNLVGNALKFRVAGRTPQISIASKVTAIAWRVSITDNGVGITPDQIGRLFQVFARLQSRSAYEGTGIGLALCRKIVEHHGGSILAASEGDDLGSCFSFSLPMTAEATEEPTKANA